MRYSKLTVLLALKMSWRGSTCHRSHWDIFGKLERLHRNPKRLLATGIGWNADGDQQCAPMTHLSIEGMRLSSPDRVTLSQ